jgi:IPT/TIG domain-containing protein
MRKSQSRTRVRLACLGVASVATATAAVAISATPAFATSTLSASQGLIGSTLTLTDSTLSTAATPGVLFSTTSCYGSVSGTANSTTLIPATNISKATSSDTTVSFTVPALPVNTSGTKTYYVCAFAGVGAGQATKTTSDVTFTVATMTPSVGSSGTLVNYGEAGIGSANTTVGIQLRSDTSCASTTFTAPTATIVNATNITKTGDSTVSFTVPTLQFATNGLSKAWYVCAYAGVTAGSTLLSTSATGAQFTVYSTPTLSATSGTSGGGNTLTVTSTTNPIFTNVTAPAALFVNGACPTTYAAPGGFTWPASPYAPYSVAATVTKSTTAPTTTATVVVPAGVVGAGTTSTSYNVCLYASNSGGGLLAASAYSVGLPTVSLSSSSGPYNSTTNGLTVTGATNFLTGITAPGATFTNSTTCPQVYQATASGNVAVVSTNVRKLAGSNNRLAITVPALPLTNSAPTPYLACIYNGSAANTSTLLASAAYTSTILPNPTSLSPSAGPATGGTPITVTGTDFPTTAGSITSATLGGVPLTNITPVNSTSFTAVTPAHPVQDGTALVVTTAAGTKSLPGAFDFVNAITVTPNTAENTSPGTEVDVQGMGFYNMSFGSGTGNSRVFLVRGTYNAAGNAGSTPGRANGPQQECINVLTITDTELVCTLRLNRRLNSDAGMTTFDPTTYAGSTTPANSDFVLAVGTPIVTTTVYVFSRDDVGAVITGAGIPNGTTIVAVLNTHRAKMSANATANGAITTAGTIGGAVHTVANPNLNFTSGIPTITAPAGTFTQADVNRIIKGVTGIPNGTTITAVAPGGTSATLSAAPTGNSTKTLTVTSAASTALSSSSAFTTGAGGDLNAVVGANTIGIVPGTTFATVTDASNVVLSAAASSSNGNGTVGAGTIPITVQLILYPAAPVPPGAYTITVVSNGDVDADTTDSNFSQSVVSSSATFTVSGF